MGRSNFLGSYLVLVIPLTVALGIVQDPQRLLRRLLWGVLLAGQAIVLVLTSARSAWIGFAAAGLTAFLLGLFAWRQGMEMRWRRLVLPLCLLCAASLLAIVLGFRQIPSESDLVLPRPLQSLFNVTSGSTAARIAIWDAVVKLIKERPLLGFGPERLDPIFWRVFPPQLVYYQGREFLVDRAHNLWLDLAIDTGLVGIVAFALMGLVWGRAAWRGLAASRNPKTRLLWIGLIAAVVGHLVDMQFSFEVTTTAVVFWLVMAGGFALSNLYEIAPTKPVEAARANGRLRQMTPSVLLAAALVSSTVVLSYLSLRFVQADLSFRQAYDERLALDERRQQTIRAIQLWPMQWSYRMKLAALEVQQQDFASAETQLLAVDQLVRDDPEVWRLQADLFAQWEDVDPLQQEKTAQAYQRMIRLAPNVARYHEGLGLVLARRGALEQAVKELEQTLNLDATDVSAYRNLTIFYRALGRNEEADSSDSQAQYWAKRTTE